jgi:hypothetical protein
LVVFDLVRLAFLGAKADMDVLIKHPENDHRDRSSLTLGLYLSDPAHERWGEG